MPVPAPAPLGSASLGRGAKSVGALFIGGGTIIKKVVTGTVAAVNPASIAAATTGETDVTIVGLAVGDIVLFHPPATLDAGIVISSPSRVSAADTAKLRLANVTVGAIDVASATWTYTWIDLT